MEKISIDLIRLALAVAEGKDLDDDIPYEIDPESKSITLYLSKHAWRTLIMELKGEWK